MTFSFAVTVTPADSQAPSVPTLEFHFRNLPSLVLRPSIQEVQVLGRDFVRQLLEHVAKAAMEGRPK